MAGGRRVWVMGMACPPSSTHTACLLLQQMHKLQGSRKQPGE